DLALRRHSAAVDPLQGGFELGRNGDQRTNGSPGHHYEGVDRVRVGGVRHRERELGLVFANGERARLAKKARRDALFENRKFRVTAGVEQREVELQSERLDDVALGDEAERDQQLAQLFAASLLEAQRALERRLIELAALDQDFA